MKLTVFTNFSVTCIHTVLSCELLQGLYPHFSGLVSFDIPRISEKKQNHFYLLPIPQLTSLQSGTETHHLFPILNQFLMYEKRLLLPSCEEVLIQGPFKKDSRKSKEFPQLLFNVLATRFAQKKIPTI